MCSLELGGVNSEPVPAGRQGDFGSSSEVNGDGRPSPGSVQQARTRSFRRQGHGVLARRPHRQSCQCPGRRGGYWWREDGLRPDPHERCRPAAREGGRPGAEATRDRGPQARRCSSACGRSSRCRGSHRAVNADSGGPGFGDLVMDVSAPFRRGPIGRWRAPTVQPFRTSPGWLRPCGWTSPARWYKDSRRPTPRSRCRGPSSPVRDRRRRSSPA